MEFEPLLKASTTQIYAAIDPVSRRVLSTLTTAERRYVSSECAEALPCLGIGLVVTDPEFQGYGLASELLRLAESKSSAALSVLWSDKIDFYEKRGYVACGSEAQVVIPEQLPLNTSMEFTGAATQCGWERHTDWKNWFRKLPNSHLLEMGSSYALIGKGRDMHRVVHELGGDPKNWRELLLQAQDLGAQRLLLPYYSQQKIWAEQILGPSATFEKAPMSLTKCLSVSQLISWIRGARPSLPVQLESDGSFSIGASGFRSFDGAHLLQLFFGPLDPTELEGLPEAAAEQLKPISLPIPFYIWGLESV
jgi:hypothetical protein